MLQNQPNPYLQNPYTSGVGKVANPYANNPYMAKTENDGIIMDAATLKGIIARYKTRPRAFNDNQIAIIGRHAAHYNIPFTEDEQTFGDKVGGMVKQIVEGYISGFTTINVGEAPQTPYEGIARSVGSLAGFVGYLPGAPVRAIGALTRIKGNAPNSIERLGVGLSKMSGKYSIPLLASDAIMKKSESIFKTAVSKVEATSITPMASAVKFLQNPAVADTITRSARLGFASAIGSWQGGIDDMAKSFAWGAVFGGSDVVVANLVRMKDPKALALVKGVAGSLMNGLPSTLQGQTTPEQVYQYLLGGYFGATERPWEERYANTKALEWKKSGLTRNAFLKKNPIPEKAMPLFTELVSDMSINPILGTALEDAIGQEGIKDTLKQWESFKLQAEREESDTQDNKVASDPGQGTPTPYVPLTGRLAEIINTVLPAYKSEDGVTPLDAKRLLTGDISDAHKKALNEWDAVKDDRHYYRNKMLEHFTSEYTLEPDAIVKITDNLNAISRDIENNQEMQFWIPIIDKLNTESPLTVGKTGPGYTKDPNGKPLNERSTGTLLGDALPKGETIRYIKSIYTKTKFGAKEEPFIDLLHDITGKEKTMKESDRRNREELRAHAYAVLTEMYNKHGYYLYGGNNAKADAISIPIHVQVRSFRNDEAAVEMAFDTAVDAMTRSTTWGKNRTHEQLKKEILSNMEEDVIFKEPIKRKVMFLSNILYEMQMQGQRGEIASMADYFGTFADSASMVKSIKAWTKRNQLILSAGSRMSKQAFENLDKALLDNPAFKGFNTSRVLIVEDAKIKYSDPEAYAGMVAGRMEASTDAAGVMLNELFDPSTEFVGHGRGNGTMKDVGASIQGPNGTLLLKLALHNIATPELRKIMIENGITHVLMKTGAKTMGMRQSISPEKLMANDVMEIQSKVFEMPWEDWKVNTGKNMSSKKAYKSKMRLGVQVANFINGSIIGGEDGDFIDAERSKFLTEVLRKNFAGEVSVNKEVEKFLATKNPTTDQINYLIDNLDAIGKDYIYKLLQDDSTNSVSNKIVAKLLNGDLEDLDSQLDSGEMNQEEYDSAYAIMSAESSVINKALIADTNNANLLLRNPITRKMANRVVYNYILSAATRPKIGNSMELSIAGYLAWQHTDENDIMRKLNDEVDPEKGYKFYLGMGAREKMITRANGKKEALGKIYDRVTAIKKYNETHTEQRTTDAEDVELLRFVVSRTPHGNPSSAVVMELGGFDSNMGHRIYVHLN